MTPTKETLRDQLLAARRALPAAERAARSEAVQRALLGLEAFRAARTIGLYRPLKSEVGTERVFAAAHAAGKRACFPRVRARRHELRFFTARFDDVFEKGPLGFEAPAAGEEVPAAEIELLVLPGVAFDRGGHRLGLGGGYFDRVLAEAPPRLLKVGLCFAFQLVGSVPAEPHDVAVDWVVTEEETIAVERSFTSDDR